MTSSARRLARIVRKRPAPWVAGLLATAVGIAYLLVPYAGRDLAAQFEHAHFARSYPTTPVDLSWFGGSLPFGYSLWTPPVMAWLGTRLVGAIATVAAAVLTVVLFERTAARRPLLAGMLLVATLAVNLVEGRVTFTLGAALAIGALVAVTADRLVLAAVLCFVAAAASPVVAIFVWLCAGALLLTRHWRPAVALVLGTAVPVAITTLAFGDGGYETFEARDARDAALASLAIALFVPLARRALKIGGALGVVMVVAAYVLHTPVGNNATRLSMIFAVPVVAAYVTWRPWLAGLAVLLTAWPQQVTARYVFRSGPAATAAYYRPLLAQVQHGLTGRVEVPETQAHWDAYYLAKSVPLARGWIRQVDLELNKDVFFDGAPSAAAYESWLHKNAVQYVAVPDTDLTHAGAAEVHTIDTDPPYLRRIWSDENWTLYAVRDFVPVVDAPQLAMSAASLSFAGRAHATVDVRIRWWRWLTLTSSDPDACIEPGAAGMTRLRTAEGGTYRITSTLGPTHGHC